ncbi:MULTISPECIES: TraH family protein [unclassified Rhizobium]|uniref:TraH family protein n=1 Tax=unclassified Rhizobium TaxID=2613769 RepID=UPI001C82A3AD|nr:MULTISPECIES: TraH family protein [unclassified Rhizobium]MBX5166827.1 conjugal transfer protein TraH [Rhizobium sp. NZLR4b]MBX5186365.1 conjugal transfer protein TraH [Rhizobium sp. NZLR5]
MLDAVLIHQCADPSLKPAIVEQFIAKAGSQDPLALAVRSGNRVVLVPKPRTPEEALALIRDNLGRNTVRVGITQYPAGVGIVEAGQLKPEMVEPCENIRLGTALFAKVWRLVMKWYGNPTAKEVLPQVMDDAVIAWQTGYFEGVAVFRADDPGQEETARPETAGSEKPGKDSDPDEDGGAAEPATDAVAPDPNTAGIRVDLSGIGARP